MTRFLLAFLFCLSCHGAYNRSVMMNSDEVLLGDSTNIFKANSNILNMSVKHPNAISNGHTVHVLFQGGFQVNKEASFLEGLTVANYVRGSNFVASDSVFNGPGRYGFWGDGGGLTNLFLTNVFASGHLTNWAKIATNNLSIYQLIDRGQLIYWKDILPDRLYWFESVGITNHDHGRDLEFDNATYTNFAIAGGEAGRSLAHLRVNTVTATNFILFEPQWVDCPGQIIWGTLPAGKTAVAITNLPNGGMQMMFDKYDTSQWVSANMEAPHNIAVTNEMFTFLDASNVIHFHARSLVNATEPDTIAKMQVIWQGFNGVDGVTGPTWTNIVSWSVGENSEEKVVSFSPVGWNEFVPDNDTTWEATFTRITPASAAYTGPILFKHPSIHVPVGNSVGLGTTGL